jgi:hypothetical protein
MVLGKLSRRRAGLTPASACLQGATVFGGRLLSRVAGMDIRPWPPWNTFMTKLNFMVISCTTTMAFGNIAYLHLSVSFIQVRAAVSWRGGSTRASGPATSNPCATT